VCRLSSTTKFNSSHCNLKLFSVHPSIRSPPSSTSNNNQGLKRRIVLMLAPCSRPSTWLVHAAVLSYCGKRLLLQLPRGKKSAVSTSRLPFLLTTMLLPFSLKFAHHSTSKEHSPLHLRNFAVSHQVPRTHVNFLLQCNFDLPFSAESNGPIHILQNNDILNIC
jgi:hypothetical protein